MFEKEAEIYALSNFGFRGKNSQRVVTAKIDYQYGAEFGYNKAKEEMQAQIEKIKCCEICAKSKDWRNRGICIECEKSKSHINFELRR